MLSFFSLIVKQSHSAYTLKSSLTAVGLLEQFLSQSLFSGTHLRHNLSKLLGLMVTMMTVVRETYVACFSCDQEKLFSLLLFQGIHADL